MAYVTVASRSNFSILASLQDNDGQTQCVYIPKAETVNTVANETATTTVLEATSTEVSKPKGFWSRVWGWFGF